MTQTSTSSSLTEMVSATVLYEISFERLEAHRLARSSSLIFRSTCSSGRPVNRYARSASAD